jgi:hypothetical protein
MTTRFRLWRGQLDLGQAFWTYAIGYGALANLAAASAALAVIVAGGPPAALVFLLPAPYTLTAAVGVWRSAGRYRGPAERASLARIAVVVWAVVVTLI